MRASIELKVTNAIARCRAAVGRLVRGLGANAVALLLLVGVVLLLVGIAMQLWLVQAAATALVSVLISWTIRVLLSPATAGAADKPCDSPSKSS